MDIAKLTSPMYEAFAGAQRDDDCTLHPAQLADREFCELTGSPAAPAPTRRFKAMDISPGKYDAAGDRKRRDAVRLTAVLLREDVVEGVRSARPEIR